MTVNLGILKKSVFGIRLFQKWTRYKVEKLIGIKF